MTADMYPAPLPVVRREAHAAGVRLSELCFLDLTGMRALLRTARPTEALDTRLVGATGIVRQLLELVPRLEPGAIHSPPGWPQAEPPP